MPIRPSRQRSLRRPQFLQFLEERVLLSTLPNEQFDSSPSFSDLWWLNNTGQTLSSFDPTYGHATGTAGADIKAPAAWDLTQGSRNVVVAVLDTGMDTVHPDLAGNLFINTKDGTVNGVDNDANGFVDDINGWNFVTNSNNVSDSIGHGTSVAGVIGAVGNNATGIVGVNWHVSILPVVVGDASGVTAQNLINGINYVIKLKQEGFNIVAINASYADFSQAAPTSSEIAAISNAGANGIMYVNAAGNGGADISALSLLSGWSSLTNVITVAATDNQDHLASFSNYGGTSVQLGAPGVDILTTVPSLGGANPTPYAFLSGTSYAAPMVSGAVALLAEEAPTATMAQIRAAILNSVDADPALVGKTTTGGRLDIARALQTLIGNQAPLGAVDAVTTASIQGWAFDFNAGSNSISVEVAIDGVMQTPVLANGVRPDLQGVVGSTLHGFTIPLGAALTYGAHTLDVYAIDNPTGNPVKIYHGTYTRANPPYGNVETATASSVSGWAFDPVGGANSITVQVYVDGVYKVSGVASNARTDLTRAVGSPNHGFSLSWSGVGNGAHTIKVYALDFTYNTPVLIGSKVVTNTAPIGSVDLANTTRVAGWTLDPDSPTTSINVRVDIDGVVGTPFAASGARSDIAAIYGSANHGFSFTYPSLPLAPGFHRIDVWAIDANTGALTLLGSKTVNANSSPIGRVESITATGVIGWAFDADAGSRAINVRVVIDGVQRPDASANVFRSDMVAAVGSANHGFNLSLPQLTPGVHTIAVYAIDPQNNNLVQLGAGSVTIVNSTSNPQPFGNVEVLTATRVAGWAFDTASGATPVFVRVDVDGTTVITPAAANIARSDMTKAVGSPNHGYDFTLSLTPNASHVVDVYYIDPQSSTPILKVSKLFGATAPVGNVELLNATTISGWAFDADYGPNPVDIRVDVDGQPGATSTASDVRNDLTRPFGSPNHGFSIPAPKLAPGAHTIVVRAIDPYTLATVIIGSAVVTYT